MFLILSFPIFGGLLYLMVNFQSTTKQMRKDIQKTQEKAAPLYSLPGDGYEKAKEEMAEHYIFLEFFIIQEGQMWNSILDILNHKAAAGVKVRVMYDNLGCFFLLPNNYPKQLEAMGIECAVFTPFRPFLTVKQNNRDHRKLAIIDGKVAFTDGGTPMKNPTVGKSNTNLQLTPGA